ncbi:hypothetical protein [Paraburkholderia hospita]|uniref:hypothetical protein n=1 Tax=Paraburkholderia hospita TaxID=169430 RepID=UPI003ECDE96A
MNIFKRLFGKKPESAAGEPARGQSSWKERAKAMSVQASPAMVKEEQRAQAKVLALLEARVTESGLFLPERIPELMAKLRRNGAPFQRPDVKAALEGETYLSVEEKRKLGLNTRAKYSHAFIACCNVTSLNGVDPKLALGEMHLAVYHAVNRERQLARFKQDKVVKTVKIFPLGNPDACAKVQRMKRAYELDEVPMLPVEGCDATCCMCGYDAHGLGAQRAGEEKG